MGTLTINVNDCIESSFRKRVHQVYGRRKGSLGKAIAEAMEEWERKKENFEKCMKLLEEGVDLGQMQYSNRDELHERN